MALRFYQTGAAPAAQRLDLPPSRRHVAREPTLPVGGKRQRGANILALQVGVVAQNFILRHSARQVVEDVVHRDAQPSQARLTAALPWLDGDSLPIVLDRSLLSLHNRRQIFC